MNARFRNCQGWSTLYALFAIVIVSIAIGVCMSTTSSTLRFIKRGRDYTNARLAAEGAIEYAWGAWKNNIQSNGQDMTTSQASGLVSGTNILSYMTGSDAYHLSYDTGAQHIGSCSGTLQIQAVDAYGVPTTSGAPIAVPTTLSSYPGWTAFVYNYLATVRVVSGDTGDNPNLVAAGAARTFQYVTVPIFEAMFYYQDDLEIYDPATMTVGGLVHTNSNLYLSAPASSTLTFTGNVSYSGTYYPGFGGGLANSGTDGTPPPGAVAWSNVDMSTPTYNGSVSDVPTQYPLGTGTSSINSVLSSTSSNTNINDGLHELIDPETTGTGSSASHVVAPDAAASGTNPADPSQVADNREYNKAGLIIDVSGTTVSVAAYDGEGNPVSITTSQTNSIKSAVTTGSFYDARQEATENVANLDIGALSSVITGTSSSSQLFSSSGGTFNGVVYMYYTPSGANAPPLVSSTLSTTGYSGTYALRLKNGSSLPGGSSATSYYTNGLSVVSENPIYIQGDYNTGATGNSVPTNTSSGTVPQASGYTRVPSAVMGDAVMFLSNSWTDQTANGYSEKNASSTTYNTAILAGIVPSVTSSGTSYSGGANNFARFLENWSSATCTYYGAMAELYTSKYYTMPWCETNSANQNVYSPPTRHWNYDTNFNSKEPPGTIYVYSYTRGPWQKF